MPILEYSCTDCGEVIEKNVSIADIKKLHDIGADIPVEIKCEKCGGKAYRIPSRFSFSFKGGPPTKKFYK